MICATLWDFGGVMTTSPFEATLAVTVGVNVCVTGDRDETSPRNWMAR